MSAILVEHVSKSFGSFTALKDVSFEVKGGALAALLGPSGSGKSTILRLLAGLERADAGAITIDGEPLTVGTSAGAIGFVFQHYALFRHMTVRENIAFGPYVQGVAKADVEARVNELLALTGLQGMGHRYPRQLSGGQRQRVALARALAPNPRLLLLDEPFAAVDAKVREELRLWLRRLHDETGVTSIFVTHDQEEAFSVADQVVILNRGMVEQSGSPVEILEHPASEFVARFVSEANAFEVVMAGGDAVAGALSVARDRLIDGDLLKVDVGRAHLVVRAYDIRLWRDDPGIGTVQRVIPLGDRVRVEAEVDGLGVVFARFPRRSSLLNGIEPGCRVHVEVTAARCYPIS